jgi:hypothetical protein
MSDDPSRFWPLREREKRLPKWARLEIIRLRCAEINSGMQPDIRGVAKSVFGGNCTFIDDDLNMLAAFAVKAIDLGAHEAISDASTRLNITSALEARRGETGTGSIGEADDIATAQPGRQTASNPLISGDTE